MSGFASHWGCFEPQTTSGIGSDRGASSLASQACHSSMCLILTIIIESFCAKMTRRIKCVGWRRQSQWPRFRPRCKGGGGNEWGGRRDRKTRPAEAGWVQEKLQGYGQRSPERTKRVRGARAAAPLRGRRRRSLEGHRWERPGEAGGCGQQTLMAVSGGNRLSWIRVRYVRGIERLPTKRIRGVRAALRRETVARILKEVVGKKSWINRN